MNGPSKINTSALPLAREEYEKQLTTLLQPLITKGFWSIYNDARKQAKKENKEEETFKKFQFFIKKIRNWSSLIIDAETDRIKEKIGCLSELITIIFVGNVKILASIRLKGKHANIKIKVPSCSNFIHSVYINTAKRIFYDPTIFDHTLNPIEKESNMIRVYGFISKAISETISQMLPLDNILQVYLGDCLAEEASESEYESGSESETEGESLYGDEIESENENPKEFHKVKDNVLPKNFIDFKGKVEGQPLDTYSEDSIPDKVSEDSIEENQEENQEDNEEDSIEENQEENEEDSIEENQEDNEENSIEDSIEENEEDSIEENEEDDLESREGQLNERPGKVPPFLETGPNINEMKEKNPMFKMKNFHAFESVKNVAKPAKFFDNRAKLE